MTSFDKSTAWKIQKDSGKANDFISFYKKQKAFVPGPIYDTNTAMGKRSPTKHNPLIVKFHKSKIPNFIDNTISMAKLYPGVGKYDTETKRKIVGAPKQTSPKGEFLNEAMFKGMKSAEYYNLVDVEKYKMNRSPILKIKGPVDKKAVESSGTKSYHLSPQHYKLEDKYKKLSTYEAAKDFKFAKGKRMTFTEIETKRRMETPGVGKYDHEKGQNRLTLGARRGYK